MKNITNSINTPKWTRIWKRLNIFMIISSRMSTNKSSMNTNSIMHRRGRASRLMKIVSCSPSSNLLTWPKESRGSFTSWTSFRTQVVEWILDAQLALKLTTIEEIWINLKHLMTLLKDTKNLNRSLSKGKWRIHISNSRESWRPIPNKYYRQLSKTIASKMVFMPKSIESQGESTDQCFRKIHIILSLIVLIAKNRQV